MSDLLKHSGQAGSKGGFRCFWCRNQTWTPPTDTSGALKIVKNRLQLRKLKAPKVEGGQELKKKQTIKCYKAGS